MRAFVFHSPEGEVQRYSSGASEVFEGEGVLEVSPFLDKDPFKCYVSEGELLVRPTMDLEVSYIGVAAEAYICVENIPVGAEVILPDGAVVVDDGYIEWAAVEPGTYPLEVRKFPYLPEVVDATFE